MYGHFKSDDGEEWGSFEVFYDDGKPTFEDSEGNEAGWYWWACFPGCMPDGEACGPFKTEDEAIADAQDIA